MKYTLIIFVLWLLIIGQNNPLMGQRIVKSYQTNTLLVKFENNQSSTVDGYSQIAMVFMMDTLNKITIHQGDVIVNWTVVKSKNKVINGEEWKYYIVRNENNGGMDLVYKLNGDSLVLSLTPRAPAYFDGQKVQGFYYFNK